MQVSYRIAYVALFAMQMAAQGESWNAVAAIPSGTQIRVAGPSTGNIQGTLHSVTGDSIMLDSSAGQETFARQQVTRISVKKESHRGRHALIGLGVGAGAGLGIGVAADHNCAAKSGCFFGPNVSKEIFTPVGAIVGALVGALLPLGGWREIYKQ